MGASTCEGFKILGASVNCWSSCLCRLGRTCTSLFLAVPVPFCTGFVASESQVRVIVERMSGKTLQFRIPAEVLVEDLKAPAAVQVPAKHSSFPETNPRHPAADCFGVWARWRAFGLPNVVPCLGPATYLVLVMGLIFWQEHVLMEADPPPPNGSFGGF